MNKYGLGKLYTLYRPDIDLEWHRHVTRYGLDIDQVWARYGPCIDIVKISYEPDITGQDSNIGEV